MFIYGISEEYLNIYYILLYGHSIENCLVLTGIYKKFLVNILL